MSTVRNKIKRKLKKKESINIKTRNSKKSKDLRDTRRTQSKEEVKEEDHAIVPTNKEILKSDFKYSCDTQ